MREAKQDVRNWIESNYATQVAAVDAVTGWNVGLDDRFTLYRYRAELFAAKTLPGIGVYVVHNRAGAKRVSRRDHRLWLRLDYLFRGDKRDAVEDQVDGAYRAMMRVMDGLRDYSELTGNNVIKGVGEEEYGTEIWGDLGDLLQEQGALGHGGPIVGGYRIEVPLVVREEL